MEDKRKLPKSKFNWELAGTGNDGFRHRYSVLKDESFRNNFLNFMDTLKFDWKVVESNFSYNEEDGSWVDVKIIDIIDVCWHFQNEVYDVDVFFGSSKIILLVRTKERRTLIDDVISVSEFISPLTIEELEEIELEGERVVPESN
ncbi:MAG: hypothetical protein PF542_00595 [Nanoarchaeota archaeon]|jgi:hypothetical protein|nr:hypothetical protein [Nanoarchaeota archaeon]